MTQWAAAALAAAIPAALCFVKPIKNRRGLWGQMAAVSFPFALLFASAAFSGAAPALRYAGRLLPLALGTAFFCVFSFARWLLLARRRPQAPRRVHPLFFAVLAVYAALALWDVTVSPIWDAGLYYSSLLKAVSGFEFTFASFMRALSAQSHLTQALLVLYLPGQYLAPGSVAALNLTTLALGLLALCAYYRVMQRLFGDGGPRPVAATALLALMPQIFAFATGLNPDFGVFVGFIFLLYAFAYNQRLLAVAAALLLVFSKETGILVYGGFGLGVLLFAVLPPALAEKKHRFAAFWRGALGYWYYLLPLGMFCLNFFFGGAGTPSAGRLNSLTQGAAGTAGTFHFNFLHIVTVLNQMLVLNFNWIATIIVLAGIVVWLARTLRAGRNPFSALCAALAARPVWGVLGMGTGVYLLFTLAYVDFPLARYNLATLTALPPLMVWALGALPLKKAAMAAPAGLLALYLVSGYATVDPASRFAFPYSHSMGGATLLDVTNHTGFKYVCERHIYSRQYLNYSRLLDDIAALYGAGGRPYASYDVPQYAMQFFGNFERDYRLGYAPAQQRRVFYAPGMLPLPGHELFAEDLTRPGALPGEMLLITLPYQSQSELDKLLSLYEVTDTEVFERGGLQMRVLVCRLRA